MNAHKNSLLLIITQQSCHFYLRKLSLSTNMIEKVTGINGMKNLRVLSLGRNYIKSFTGLVGFQKFYNIVQSN